MAMHRISIALMLTILCSVMLGCTSGVEEAWTSVRRTTSHWYDSYINPPAKVDYAKIGNVDDYQRVLARRMEYAEEHLSNLERYLSVNDRWPSSDELLSISSSFPWVSGFAEISSEGDILEQEPPFDLKNLDFTKIIEARDSSDSKAISRTLVGMIQESPMGPEVMLGVPVYKDTDFIGIFLVHFDVRALLASSADATDMVITSTHGVMWPGRFIYDETPLSDVDWKAKLEGNSSGVVKNKHGSFFWLARYLGNEPLVFAIPIKGEFPEDAAQASQLFNR